MRIMRIPPYNSLELEATLFLTLDNQMYDAHQEDSSLQLTGI